VTRILQALATIVMFGVIAGVAWLGWNAWTARQRAAQASANTEVVAKTSRSQTAAGSEAVAIVQRQASSEAQIRAQTEANRDAIEHAKGADAPVDRDLYYAALRAHCLRHSSANDPACVSLRHPGS
jgi:predicted negative regulator of RcsB-dependent stress response